MSTICATKRDLEKIAKKRYVFDERLFNVYIISKGGTALNKGQEYSIKKEGDYYYLYNLLSNTGCYLDPVSNSFDVVCEEFTIYITNDEVSKPAKGRLLLKNHLYDKTVTKDEVESSDCTIKPKFKDIVSEFTDNRIIQEQYIGEPINASVWYDGRYLDIFRINESFFLPTKNPGDYTGVADRTVSDNYTNIQLRDQARSTFTCKVGDYLKIKNISEKTIVLQKLLRYDDTNSELLITNYVLSPNEYFDFIVTEDCFVVFNIQNLQGTLDGYLLTSSCPSDYTFTLTANGLDLKQFARYFAERQMVELQCSLSDYIASIDDKNKRYYIIDESGNLVVLDSVSIQIQVTKSDGTKLFNNPVSKSFTDFTVPLTLTAKEFSMPASNCHAEVTVKMTTNGGDITLDNQESGSAPGHFLYIRGDVPVTIDNKVYNPNTSLQIEDGTQVNVSWSKESGYYKVQRQYHSNNYYLLDCLTPNKNISFEMYDSFILTVQTVDADCVYQSDKPVNLKTGSDIEPNNEVLGHYQYVNTRVIDTESPMYSSSIPNVFQGTNVTSVEYITNNETFTVSSKAFKDCQNLKQVSIEGPELVINQSAFENTVTLENVKGIGNTSFLGNQSFYNSGLKLFHSINSNLTTIPLSAFEECDRLQTVLLNELNLTSIKESAFKNTPSLKLVKLPKNINSIEKEAFAYSGINKIVTSDLHSLATDGFWFVTDDKTNGLSVIEEGVFKGCTNLKDIELPDSIEHLETLSFAECDNIQNFASPGLKTIAQGAFKDTWVEKQQYFNQLNPNRPNYDNDSLRYKEGTSGVYFEFIDKLTAPLCHVALIKPDDNKNEYILYKRKGLLPGVTNIFNVTSPILSISDYGFSKNDVQDYAQGYSLYFSPSGNSLFGAHPIKHIGNYAFENCGAFSIHFNGSQLEYLGEGAFKNCKVLNNVVGLEESLISEIKPYTFYGCGDNFSGLGSNSNGPFTRASNFYLPSNVTKIGAYAFAECPQLMAIQNIMTCPITEIEEYAFYRCFRNTAIRSEIAVEITLITAAILACAAACVFGIGIGSGVAVGGNAFVQVTKATLDTVIANYSILGGSLIGIQHSIAGVATGWFTIALAGAAGMGAVTADIVENLAPRWRKKLKNTSELLFPKVTKLGKSSFEQCTYLGSIVLNEKLKEIPERCFYNCKRLGFITFTSDEYDPSNFNVQYIDRPSQVEIIGKKAFYNCDLLTDYALSKLWSNVRRIEEEAFKGAKMHNVHTSSVIMSPNLEYLGPDSLAFDSDIEIVFTNKEPKFTVEGNVFGSYYGRTRTLIVPQGTYQIYSELFKQTSNDNVGIHELPDDDPFWHSLQNSGIDIEWINDQYLDLEYVDLGLSVKWCANNLMSGAPECLGLSYGWAGFAEHRDEWTYYRYYDEDAQKCTKYTANDNLLAIKEEDDAAYQLTNGKYRIPTKDEFDELLTKCQWEYLKDYRGTQVYKVTGLNKNYIIIPAKGKYDSTDTIMINPDMLTTYWCAQRSESNENQAYAFCPDTMSIRPLDRCINSFIRPVYIGD